MQTLNYVSGLHNCLEFSQPFSRLYEALERKRKKCSIANVAAYKYVTQSKLNVSIKKETNDTRY